MNTWYEQLFQADQTGKKVIQISTSALEGLLRLSYMSNEDKQQIVDNAVAQINRDILNQLECFVKDIAGQTPEKPDYWSSCSQCERNKDNAQDILDKMRA